MGAYLGLRDSWLLEDDALLDSIEALQAQADGTFYPIGLGPESCAGIACPDLWGYLFPPTEAEAFERLFLAHEDKRIAKLYAKRFAYVRWRDGAGDKPEVGFLPAPVLKETPLPGSGGKKATWARFWSWGPAAEYHFDMYCDLITGRCSAEIVSEMETLPAARFRVAAANLRHTRSSSKTSATAINRIDVLPRGLQKSASSRRRKSTRISRFSTTQEYKNQPVCVHRQYRDTSSTRLSAISSACPSHRHA